MYISDKVFVPTENIVSCGKSITLDYTHETVQLNTQRLFQAINPLHILILLNLMILKLRELLGILGVSM